MVDDVKYIVFGCVRRSYNTSPDDNTWGGQHLAALY